MKKHATLTTQDEDYVGVTVQIGEHAKQYMLTYEELQLACQQVLTTEQKVRELIAKGILPPASKYFVRRRDRMSIKWNHCPSCLNDYIPNAERDWEEKSTECAAICAANCYD